MKNIFFVFLILSLNLTAQEFDFGMGLTFHSNYNTFGGPYVIEDSITVSALDYDGQTYFFGGIKFNLEKKVFDKDYIITDLSFLLNYKSDVNMNNHLSARSSGLKKHNYATVLSQRNLRIGLSYNKRVFNSRLFAALGSNIMFSGLRRSDDVKAAIERFGVFDNSSLLMKRTINKYIDNISRVVINYNLGLRYKLNKISFEVYFEKNVNSLVNSFFVNDNLYSFDHRKENIVFNFIYFFGKKSRNI